MSTDILQKRIGQKQMWLLLPLLAAFICPCRNASAGQSHSVATIQPVRIISSPAAQKKLRQWGKDIIVSASWYGLPHTQDPSTHDEDGLIFLGHTEKHIPANGGVAIIPLTAIKREQLSRVKGAVYMTVNAFSAQQTWSDNMLTCSSVNDKPVDHTHSLITLHCKLPKEELR